MIERQTLASHIWISQHSNIGIQTSAIGCQNLADNVWMFRRRQSNLGIQTPTADLWRGIADELVRLNAPILATLLKKN